jgi:demethylmenaquinone methyltransferase / 2-methoxy-6-polyprenyl-1,4-benzoquinol methylase
MSEQVQKLFDAIAPRYDLLNGLLSLKTDRLWRKAAVREIAAPEYRNVLDLCAGTMALTRSLLDANPACHVTAIDFSEPMLRKGWENLPKALQSRVGPMVADAMDLELPPRSVDAAMCAYGMRNIDDNELVLKKLSGFLRRGGKLVILEFFRPEGIINKIFNATYAQFVIPAIGRLVSGNTEAYRYLRDSVRHYYTPTAYRELLKQAGYRKILVRPLTGGITHLVTAEAS